MHWTRRHRRGRPPHPDVLTPAEWRVLELVREGLPNADIANRLGITVPTVKSHVTSILAKTGVSDRYALAQWDGAPAEAPGRTSRGFAFPLALLSAGSVKVGAGAAAGVLFVVAVFSVYGFFFDESDGVVALDGTRSHPIVGTIDGLEVDASQWEFALWMVPWEVRSARLAWEGRDEESLAEGERYAQLIESYSPEAVALANLIVEHAFLAEALARGLEPTEEELQAYLESQQEMDERVQRGEFSTPPEVQAFLDEQREAVRDFTGTEVASIAGVPEGARRTLIVIKLSRDENVLPYSGEFTLDLARRAEVWLARELSSVVTVAEALEFLEAREALQNGDAPSDDPAATTPEPELPPPPGHPPDARTGIAEVDAVIDAVLAGEVEGLLNLARFQESPCVLETENEWRGPPPMCPEGVTEGTLVPMMVTVGCHGVLRTPDDLHHDVSTIRRHVALHAVAETSFDWWESEYYAVFAHRLDSGEVWGWALHAGQGGFVSVDLGCGFSPEYMLETYGASLVLPPAE